ncbi:MAG: hypothetical protein HZC17_09670, partial [Candidatus Omnitrophica bacterium]|nr:hypothetical protein [Candidatus Omnitrophota bacterium]
MRIKKLADQIAVVFALITFSTSTVFAAPFIPDQTAINKSQPKIEIPSALGEVTALSLPKNAEAPFFIHIQDAHANEMAQRKIKEILELLNQNYNIKLFGIEGAHKSLKPSVLHVAQNPETNLKIAEYMVTRGWLSGGDWFAVEQYEKNKNQSDIHFEGLETASIYTRDLHLFRMGLENRSKVDAILARMDGNVDRLKSKIFSRGLLKFDRAYQLFGSSEHKNLLDYFKEIKRQAREVLNLDLGNPVNQMKYPQLVRLSRLAETQKSTANLDQLTREIERLKPLINGSASGMKDAANIHAQILSELLKPADQMDYHPFGSWREAFESIYQVMESHQIAWKAFPAMAEAARNLIFQEELASLEMFAEIDTLVNEIENKMAKSPEETSLIALAKEMSLFRQMARLEASREQAEDVLARKQSMLVMIESLFDRINHESSGLAQEDKTAVEAQLQLALQFYRGAKDREKAFVDHLVEYAKKYQANRLAFITGGYHTRGVREELERRGYGYMSISPRMLSENPLQGLKESSRLYEDVMTGKQKTIFNTAYIPEEDNLLSVPDAAQLGVKNRVRAERLVEAIAKRGAISDLAGEIKSGDVANGLQKILAGNKILGADGVQVAEGKDDNGKVLRISLASNRRGIVTDFPVVIAPEAAQAASLGAEKKAAIKSRRRANKVISTILAFTTGLLPSFLITGTVAVGAAGCAPREMIITVAPDISPELSGQISTLPLNNYVNPLTQASEPHPAVTFTAEDNPLLGTRISGDTSLLNLDGVKTIAVKVEYNLDDSVQKILKDAQGNLIDHFTGLGISFDDFTTPNTHESPKFKLGDEVIFYVKSDANTPQLKLTIEGADSTDPAKKQLNFFTLKNTSQGGWYRVKIADLRGIDIEKIYTMAIVADPGVLGKSNAKGS